LVLLRFSFLPLSNKNRAAKAIKAEGLDKLGYTCGLFGLIEFIGKNDQPTREFHRPWLISYRAIFLPASTRIRNISRYQREFDFKSHTHSFFTQSADYHVKTHSIKILDWRLLASTSSWA
jgi:hypothetical protein